MSDSGKIQGEWDLAHVERPWGEGPSIYGHIRAHIVPGATGLADGAYPLPDEQDDGRIKWGAGALDGAFGHHFGTVGAGADRAKMLHRALGVVLQDAAAPKLEKLYAQLMQSTVLGIVDPLLERIVDKQDLDPGRLGELASWIAHNAPDRGPVKVAIALLGLIPGAAHRELFLTLGRHEEFTLYAAVALTNAFDDVAEPLLFELARQVHGWGRIHIVERLADTRDPAIKAWMLREGYANTVTNEYLACTCAVAGGLRAALEADLVDQALLAGAADIIRALIAGGPAENMDDYADGAVVVERFLHHLGPAPATLDDLVTIDRIQRFLDDGKADWTARATRGWTSARRARLDERVRAMKALPHWKPLIDAALAAEGRDRFYDARQAARALGIDTWGHDFARLERGVGDGWYFVMQTDDPARVDRVVALAEETLPLDAIASGPAEASGLGPGWTDHGHLGFVLQELRRFPGRGWPLIRAGLRSPVIRNRHMALRALSPWGMARWPADARALLETARAEEPRDDVRASIETLLAGKMIE